MNEFEQKPGRPDARRFAALLIIIAATALALGHTLRQPTQMGANDISRWCTVWSLLERGTYVIDECPWQVDTQDKVFRAPKGASAAPDGQEPVRHYYSSKPAFLPTLIAGILYPARLATGVPLDRVVLQERAPRWTQKPDPDSAVRRQRRARDAQGARALAGLHLLLQADRGAAERHSVRNLPGPLRSRARPLRGQRLGLVFLSGRRGVRHLSLAVYADPEQSHGRGLQCLLRPLPALLDLGSTTIPRAGDSRWPASSRRSPRRTSCRPSRSWSCCSACCSFRFPGKTLRYFVPGALVPIAAFVAAQYAVFGEFKLAYEAFGTDEYLYEGSLWKTPLELDAFNEHPEPYATYFFHMTLGHHGVFSLTPIFLFSALGAVRLLGAGGWFPLPRRGGPAMAAVAWLTTVLTVVLLAFYTWNPKARNYGGSTQGLRWLFWLIPFWLLLLPKGVEWGQTRRWFRGLALLALGISVMSVGYAIRNPWSSPWILDALEHLNLYPLTR